METLIQSGQSRKFYQDVRNVKKGYQPRTQTLEDHLGNLIMDNDEIKTMWMEYFKNLLNKITLPTFEEVKKAIIQLKNNKSLGIDGVPAELWKYSGPAVQHKLYELLKMIWQTGKQPLEWNMGIICPIHKKGSKKKCHNYRGIALLPTAYNIGMPYIPYYETLIPKLLVDLIMVATSKSTMRVRVGNELSDEFEVITGLKQGDALSPMLFNLVLEHVLKRLLTLEPGLQLKSTHKVIGYVDDLALLGESREQVEQAAKILEEEAKKVGLKINHEKTEYLHMKRYRNIYLPRQNLHVGDVMYKGVAKFNYLGSFWRELKGDAALGSFIF
ncbi:hypothetical protein K1T71_007694 [Dendrolimus kikuchii]|uniref:Uncharacterized protein n=1 Tax=Dendrolimus kikuchii TaxID=765133 RepID=A0ACC1CY70_9NEOP|nr:hypothetical protein K1T71_007694 [Dendrolimus kikuchii]